MTKLVPSTISKGEIEGCPACPGVPWGLAFETWDPSNQFLLETPALLFAIRSAAEGPAVPRVVVAPYSVRKACTGLIDAPRRAGIIAAIHAATPKTKIAPAMTRASARVIS